MGRGWIHWSGRRKDAASNIVMESLLQAVEESVPLAEDVPIVAGKFGNVWLERWHLFSLDAPSVALAWMWLVARSAGVELPWTEFAAMFLAVWMLYVADRLLDARPLGDRRVTELERRHHFHHKYRLGFCWGIGFACAGLAALLPEMPRVELERYMLLGILLVGWFGLIHTVTKPLPKEFMVGIFFAAAVFIAGTVRATGMGEALLFPAVMLGVVCCLNCVFIYAWESGAGFLARAHHGTKLAARIVVLVALGVAGVCGLGSLLPGPGRQILLACAESALLLLGLHFLRERIEKTSLRAFADFALLTPLLAWLWLR